MEKKPLLQPGQARLLGASLCACSRALREAAPHAYFPGWEETSFDAVTQRVLLCTWYQARKRALEVPTGQKLNPWLLGIFMALSGPSYKTFTMLATDIAHELFDPEQNPDTGLLRELSEMMNADLADHGTRLLGFFDGEVCVFIEQIANAYVRDLYGAMNGTEVYLEAWCTWNQQMRADLAERRAAKA